MYPKMKAYVLIALVFMFLFCGLATADEIDLLWGTFLGGSNAEQGLGIAVDDEGCAYVTGQTRSADFPTTAGIYDETYNGGSEHGDVYVAKFNPMGRDLEYATYLGGSGDDAGHGIAVDAAGDVYVTGWTESFTGALDFPTTSGAFDETHNGDFDVFVAKLASTGGTLDYSTFLGGSDCDQGTAIKVDGPGSAYVTGITSSSGYPATPGSFDETHNGNEDVFVAKLKPTGSDLDYATYLGGVNPEQAHGIAVDSLGNVYLTGWTKSINFPVTPGVLDATYNGYWDIFVAKLNPTGSDLAYSTFLGTSEHDEHGTSIAVDGSGNAYVTGSVGADFPTTPGAFDRTHNGYWDVFVAKLNPTGSSLVYSTYLGGELGEAGWGVAVYDLGNACVTGGTYSSDFPTAPEAFDTTHNGGGRDVFVAILDPTGSDLAYSTFLGGGANDKGDDISVDVSGNVYITGYTESSGFPATGGAFDATFNGWSDAFVVKLGVGDTTVPIEATIDIDPNALNLRSRGKWITCYIELPEGYDVNDIDVASVRFEGSLPAAEKPYGVGNEDEDEIPDLMVKFARAEAGNLLAVGDSVEVTVSGMVLGETFSGTDVIRVFMPGRHAVCDTTVRKLRVRQNYPNPFNPDTKIVFNIAHTSNVKVEIFNILGQRVNTLLDGHLEAGDHTVEWDGQGSNGQPLAGGIYFYRLTAGDLTETRKMILLR